MDFRAKFLDRANTLDFDEPPSLLLTPTLSKGRGNLDEETGNCRTASSPVFGVARRKRRQGAGAAFAD